MFLACIFLALIILLFMLIVWGVHNSNKCSNGGLEHKFEARYSEEFGEMSMPNMHQMPFLGYSAEDNALILETRKPRKITYVHDVCIWCGQTVKNTNHE